MFESLDGDSYDRSVQPIYVTSDSGYYNVLNSMMDHVWDGFYTGQTRISRFPVQIDTTQDYTIQMTGTPPGTMRFKLDADKGTVKIKIPYPNAGSYVVFAEENGKSTEKAYTPWNNTLGRHSELTKYEGCGENRFVGVENFLEFTIDPDCTIEIKPKDSIMSSVRLDWTMAEFYADNGVVSFTDRVAAALGIHASQIKVVAVYTGSVIIDFLVISEEDD